MEGSLLKKTKGGQWHSRQFKLEGSNLTWLKSDGKTTITVDVGRGGAQVQEPKFSAKKFVFDIILPGDSISLSASGEAEKAAWMAALKVAMGKRDEAEGILQKSGAGRMSVRSPLKPIVTPSKSAPTAIPKTPASPVKSPAPAASAASPISPVPLAKTETGSVVTGGLSSQAANAKLQAKLGGKLGMTQATLCVVCGQTVYKPEELIVDKAAMHKRCFQCNHCKRLLTMGNFACINGTFYCKVHYFELFSTNGGKYDKAFGDAGFKTKATTSYTPGEVLQPGKLASKATSPPPKATLPPSKATSPTTEKPAAPAAAVESPAAASTPAPVKAVPKKLEIKAPVSTKAVGKTEVEVIPKKNMDDLRKMVVLPGMAPPKSKKEQPVETPASETKAEEKPAADAEKTEAAAPKASSDDASPDAETKAAETSAESKEEAASPAPEKEGEATAAVETPTTETAETAPESIPEPEPQIQIVRPPAGVNFALEAMRIRQAQLAKAGVVLPQEEASPAEAEGRASVRISGRLDHSAVLSKPRMAGRRAPKVQEVGKLLPKTEIDRMTHDSTFRVLIDGSSDNVLIVHATSQFEREHWVATLGANVYMLGLKRDLEMAQKRDMMSALQAQINLETFMNDNKVTYQGFMEKVSMKSQRNWKKRWFVLTDKGELMYFENENSKKPKQTLQLTYQTVIASADGTRLDAPLVINTGATERSTEDGGTLPQNIAIFDNEDVTIDLQTIIPDDLKVLSDGDAGDAVQAGASSVVEVSPPTADDFVVVEKKDAVEETPAAPADKAETEAAPKKSDEPSAPSEPKQEPEEKPAAVPEKDAEPEAKPEPETQPESAAQPEPEPEKRINDAWATPGKAPDRIKTGEDQPLKDASPSSPSKRRQSSGKKARDCTIM